MPRNNIGMCPQFARSNGCRYSRHSSAHVQAFVCGPLSSI